MAWDDRRVHPGPYYTVKISHCGAETYTDLKEAQEVVRNYPDSHPEVHTTWDEADEFRDARPAWNGLYTVDDEGDHRYVAYVCAYRDEKDLVGIGVWFGDNNPCNYTGPLEEVGISQKRAELLAIHQALQIIEQRCEVEKWQLRVRNLDAFRSVTTEMEAVREKHYRGPDGELVANGDMYWAINRWIFMKTFYGDIFAFKHVCNVNEKGYRRAMKLAKRGVHEPTYEVNWG
ncbi:hypothetical protein CJU89_2383 [Yarrowia sp. B02]|nr:hypothetical protein CJU89_2383 [Yarrowia sp. B02]